MPLIVLARFVTALISLALIAASIYLLGTWYQGETYPVVGGDTVRFREDWRLWVGAGLLAWSVLGRFVMLLVLAKPDTRPTRAVRGAGEILPVHDGSLYVEKAGDPAGATLILTHGWGLDSTIWNYAKEDLARFSMTTWDLRGLGKSRVKRPPTVNLECFADDLAVLVKQAGRPVVLAGHSIGGMVIQTLARDHPELFGRNVVGVVLINTTHTNPLRTMWASKLALALRRPVIEPMMWLAIGLEPLAWLSAWQSYLSGSAHLANRIGFGRDVTRSQLEHSTLLSTRNRPSVLARGNLSMFRWDAGEGLKNMKTPVLVLGGDIDIVTKAQTGRDIAAATAADFIGAPGANHMGFLEQRELYNKAIGDFVDRVAAPKS